MTGPQTAVLAYLGLIALATLLLALSRSAWAAVVVIGLVAVLAVAALLLVLPWYGWLLIVGAFALVTVIDWLFKHITGTTARTAEPEPAKGYPTGAH